MKLTCNYCGSTDNTVIFEHARFEKVDVLKCINCGLVYLGINKTKEQLGLFYKSIYRKVDSLPRRSAEEWFNDPIVKQDCSNRIDWIEKLYGDINGTRVLEIGSSSGYFLDELSFAGAKEVIGVELTEDYADYARSLGFAVYTEPIEDIGFDKEFDLVVMFHTLEHVGDPMTVLQAIRLSLKGGGFFMGEVPNQDDWRIKIFDNEVVKHFHYDPFHCYYFSPVTLTNYLNQCGFNNVSLETVERYNSLVQLKRILCGEYSQGNIDQVLKQDIFAKPEADVRIPHLDNYQEREFNKIFKKGANSQLMGNCLRWVAYKPASGIKKEPR